MVTREGTAKLLQLISEGKCGKIDQNVLRSAIPDTGVFVAFLKRHDLVDDAEAKAVLKRLGVAAPAKPARAVAAAAAKKRPRFRSPLKRRAAEAVKAAAAKKLRKAKRRKHAKSLHK